MKTSVTVPSFAKINWHLEVLGRRPDGYHEVRTLLQSVSLEDRLTFTPRDSTIELTCDNPAVPLDRTKKCLTGDLEIPAISLRYFSRYLFDNDSLSKCLRESRRR